MNYKNQAREWFKRGLEEKDQFVKFILFYICLEVLFKLDRVNVRTLKNHSDLFKGISRKILKELIKKLSHKPLVNMNPRGDNRWNGIIKDKNDINGIVEFIIRARNNLFHGDKGLDDKRDLLIIKYGSLILEPIIKNKLNL